MECVLCGERCKDECETFDSELVASDGWGIYIPQRTADYLEECWEGIKKEDLEIIQQGPNHDNYWDAWDDILNSAYLDEKEHPTLTDSKIKRRWHLYQDGDLWMISLKIK